MEENKEMGLGSWIGTLIITCIPVVNVILLFVWAFGNGYVARKRWAQAQLIIAAVLFVIYIVLFIACGDAIVTALQSATL